MSRLALTLVLLATASFAQTTITVSAGGMSFQVDRYLPAGTGPFPVVALGHGFSNSKDNVRGLAQALQADGIAVVAPQLTGGLGVNHSLNADALIAAVDAVISAGQGDAARIGFGGHSAGGLAAWLAASRRADTKVLVLLDPVDNSGLGAAQVANVMAPTLFEFAPPQSCNTQNNAVAWFTGKPGLKGRFNVPMANHCDPQEPSNGFCTTGCGFATWNMTRSAVYKRYARAFFGQFLLGNTTSCVETMAAMDSANGTINQVTLALGNACGSDGGAGGGAAGGGAAAGGSAGGGSAGGSSVGGGSSAGGSAAGGSAAGGSAGGGSAGGGSATGGGTAGGAATAGGTAGGAATAGGSATGGGPATCGPLNCTGCCNGTVCVQASSQTCGLNGSACAICMADQVCDMGRCAATPPSGCGCNATSGAAGLVLVVLAALMRRR